MSDRRADDIDMALIEAVAGIGPRSTVKSIHGMLESAANRYNLTAEQRAEMALRGEALVAERLEREGKPMRVEERTDSQTYPAVELEQERIPGTEKVRLTLRLVLTQDQLRELVRGSVPVESGAVYIAPAGRVVPNTEKLSKAYQRLLDREALSGKPREVKDHEQGRQAGAGARGVHARDAGYTDRGRLGRSASPAYRGR